MKSTFFTEENIISMLQKCDSPGDVFETKYEIINYVVDQVVHHWNRNKSEEEDEDEKRLSITYKGTIYNYHWYGDSGCISFKEGDFEFVCRLGRGGMNLDSLIKWIDDKLEVVRHIMPIYLKTKGKIERIDGIQVVGMTTVINTLMEKYGMIATIRIEERNYEERWHMKLLGYKCCGGREATFKFGQRFFGEGRQELLRLVEPVFRFFSLEQCIDLSYREPSNNGYSAPVDTYALYSAVSMINFELSASLCPIGDNSWQSVSVELHDGNRPFLIDNGLLYFNFDFRKHSLNDFKKVVSQLNKDILIPLKCLSQAGILTEVSIFVDFEKVLSAIE